MSRKESTPQEVKKAEEQKKLGDSVAGEVQLSPEDLGAVAGGDGGDPSTEPLQTIGCCNGLTDNAGTCFPCTYGSACTTVGCAT